MSFPDLLGPLNLGPLTIAGRTIAGRPLVARFEQSSVPRDMGQKAGEDRYGVVFARDSQGRTREEFIQEGHRLPVLVKILDPASGTSLVLNPTDRTAFRLVLNSIAQEQEVGSFLFPFARIDGVLEEEILGYRCARYECRGDASVEVTGRIWVVEQMGLVLREEVSCPDQVRFWSVVSVDEGEPSEAQFLVPEGYSVADLTGFGVASRWSVTRG